MTESGDISVRAVSIICEHRQGVLRDISEVMAENGANIEMVQSSVLPFGPDRGRSLLYFEFREIGDYESLKEGLLGLDTVYDIKTYRPLSQIFGKRIIIFGGGAQVAQVALGAVNEADRHNIRGERISVDTFPVVGEKNLTAAIDAISRLPRVAVLVLAGSLMGGTIVSVVERVKQYGIPVISLSMAGSLPDHADLVVTDPIQAGVFAVMHASELAVFDIYRVRGRHF
jgi:energy-converting hydrogenase B subunit Q